MSWPPAILVDPPESVLAGIVLWKRRGTALVTAVVKQLFSVSAEGAAQPVLPHATDALTGDDRVPFKPRADVLLALREGPAARLEVWRSGSSMLQKQLLAEECVRRSIPPSGRGPAATMIDLPEGVDPRVYQIAPDDQQLDSLMPGDCLTVSGGAHARLFCPKLDLTVHLRAARGARLPIALNIDAIEWDLPNGRCAVIARGQAPWSEEIEAVVVSLTPTVAQTATLDPAAAEKARAPFVSPFRRHAANPAPPPALPVRSPDELGGTATLDAVAAARARAGAMTPFKAPSDASTKESPSIELTSYGEEPSPAARATPFVSSSSPMARAVLPATPMAPRIDSGTVASEGSEIQRIARALAGGKLPDKRPAPDAPTEHLHGHFETTAFSNEQVEYARAQALAPVPFPSKHAAPSTPRAVMPAMPTEPRIDTGTIVAQGSEIQRLARALEGPPAPPAPAPPFHAAGPPAYVAPAQPSYSPTPQPHHQVPAPALPVPARVDVHAPVPPSVSAAPPPGGLVARFLDAEPAELSALDDDELPSP